MLATIPETGGALAASKLREKSFAKTEAAAAKVVELMSKLCEPGLGAGEHRQICSTIDELRASIGSFVNKDTENMRQPQTTAVNTWICRVVFTLCLVSCERINTAIRWAGGSQ